MFWTAPSSSHFIMSAKAVESNWKLVVSKPVMPPRSAELLGVASAELVAAAPLESLEAAVWSPLESVEVADFSPPLESLEAAVLSPLESVEEAVFSSPAVPPFDSLEATSPPASFEALERVGCSSPPVASLLAEVESSQATKANVDATIIASPIFLKFILISLGVWVILNIIYFTRIV